MSTGGDVIGRALAQAGATHAFGIPGGEVLALIDGLAGAGIEFVLARHENSAGFMAEGLWHGTGALPVLVATLGPGVANAVNVVANAQQDRVPLVFLIFCDDAAATESYTHQVFDHAAVLRPLVKASFRARTGALAPMLTKALALARDGQPGPVHVDVPIGVAEGASGEAPQPFPARAAVSPSGPVLEAAQAALAAAERPLMIAGLDALDADDAVANFCRARNVPLITTYKAKGLLPEDDPLALGGAGLSPKADALLLPLVRAADCLILAGYDPIEMRAGWRNPWPADTTVIEIAPVLRDHGMHIASHVLTCEVSEGLAGLCTAPAQSAWPCGRPSQTRAALDEAFAAEADFGPGAVFEELRASLPGDAVVTADSGAHRILLSQAWRCALPRTLLQSTGLCTMACALPLAIGRALGGAQGPVVAVMGDGGLEMGLGELATLRDLGLPVIVVVLVDGSLALIEMKQRAAGRETYGTRIGTSDLPAVARAMGGEGVWIESRADLREALDMAQRARGFTLLACRVEARDYEGRF